jgi:hypothetical protein
MNQWLPEIKDYIVHDEKCGCRYYYADDEHPPCRIETCQLHAVKLPPNHTDPFCKVCRDINYERFTIYWKDLPWWERAVYTILGKRFDKKEYDGNTFKEIK